MTLRSTHSVYEESNCIHELRHHTMHVNLGCSRYKDKPSSFVSVERRERHQECLNEPYLLVCPKHEIPVRNDAVNLLSEHVREWATMNIQSKLYVLPCTSCRALQIRMPKS